MRRIDHLVIAVRDLDAAADFYRRLGFQVGARNRHPWGTENRLVQFRTSFLELITTGDAPDTIAEHGARHFSFGAFIRDYLRRREGLAMLVLSSTDAKADAASFAAAGIGDFAPFHFARDARRPDGSATRVAFTLAFATDPGAPAAGVFTCQQHNPENFWNEAFQRHPNGATAITAATLSAARPGDHRAFLAAFSGAAPVARDNGLAVPLDRGRIEVAPAQGVQGVQEAGSSGARWASFSVAVADPGRQAARLGDAGIPAATTGRRCVVPATAAHGVEIVFEAEPPE